MINRKPTLWASLAVLSLLLVSGCSAVDELFGETESIEYRSTVAGDPLVIPPDLTQANQNTHYVAPEGVTRLSQYAADQQARAATSAADRILPRVPGIEVRRDGTLRWLVVNEQAENLYPKLIDFWNEQGFTIHTQNPAAGLIETDWAENRAKIPEGWLRSALGKVLDQVFDSGERERFTTRLERINGQTEIYVSHQHMEETPTADGTAFKWVFGKEDPGLNAAMLARMMVYLGTDRQTAAAKVRAAEAQAARAAGTLIDSDGLSLVVDDTFERAWRRVGVAIDSARFTVEDRNRSQGDYYIRYLDTDSGEKIEQPSRLSRLFGSRNTAEPQHLRIHLAQAGAGTRVSVLDAEGSQLSDATARRIIEVLAKNLQDTR